MSAQPTKEDLTPFELSEDKTCARIPDHEEFVNDEDESAADIFSEMSPCEFVKSRGGMPHVIVKCASRKNEESEWENLSWYGNCCCARCFRIVMRSWRIHFFGYEKVTDSSISREEYENQCKRIVNILDCEGMSLLESAIGMNFSNFERRVEEKEDRALERSDKMDLAMEQYYFIRKLVEAYGANANHKSAIGTPMVILALLLTGLPFKNVKCLIKRGNADPNALDVSGENLMDKINFALEGPEEDSFWHTDPFLVSADDFIEVFYFLEKKGAVPSFELENETRSPRWVLNFAASDIFFCARDDAEKIAEKVFDKYRSVSDPNYINISGGTILHDYYNVPELVRRFLEMGADPTIKDKEGKTPIEAPDLKDECRALLQEAMDSWTRQTKRERDSPASSSSSIDEHCVKKQRK